MSNTKPCGRCRSNHPLSSFDKHSNWRQRDKHKGLQPWCRECCSDHRLLLQSVDYAAELYRQNYKCALCFEQHDPRPRRGLVVDHCYETGLFRALLCPPCNTRLGVIEDDEWMRAAQRYLEKT